MRSRTNAPIDVDAAMKAALRLLSARARTRKELAALLERRGAASGIAHQVLERLEELGYLNDARYGVDRATQLLSQRRLAPAAVKQRLLAQGLSEAEADRALASARGELGFDALSAAKELLVRKGLAGRVLTPRERGSAERLLRARGFEDEIIERLLGADAGFDG